MSRVLSFFVFCLSVWLEDPQPLFTIFTCLSEWYQCNSYSIINRQSYWICSWNFHMKQSCCSRSGSISSSVWTQQELAAAAAGGGGKAGVPFISSGCGSSGMCYRSSSHLCLSCRFTLFFTSSLFIFYQTAGRSTDVATKSTSEKPVCITDVQK